MTQRNPMNPRSQARQRGDNPKGTARRSAASAKPKQTAGSSVYVASKASRQKAKEKQSKEVSKEETQKERQREAVLGAQVNGTDEYKKWRKIWWVAIIVAIVGVALSWVCTHGVNNGWIPSGLSSFASTMALILLVLGYAAIIFALWIDMKKIRKLRKAQEARARSMSKSERRKLDAEIEASNEKKEAAKGAKKFQLPWGHKKTEDDVTHVPSDTKD